MVTNIIMTGMTLLLKLLVVSEVAENIADNNEIISIIEELKVVLIITSLKIIILKTTK